MPTDTFYNLSEEKKKTILYAIKKEFSTAELKDISVNRIVEDSKIAKGSFYQYFRDKDEAIIYILKEFVETKKQDIQNILKENNGDIFKSALFLFDDIVLNKKTKEDIKFMQNVFQGIAAKGVNIMEVKNIENHECCDSKIVESINISKYSISNKLEIKAFLELIIKALGTEIIAVLNDKSEYEEAKRELEIQLRIIKNGVLKEEYRKC